MGNSRALAALACSLAAGCAVPPERAERDRAFMRAIEPCQRQYPAVRVVGFDDHGTLYTRIPEHSLGELAGFERCAKDALKRELALRPFATGKLAANAGSASVPMQTSAPGVLVPVLINGMSATLLLDTGASLTIVRPAFAQRAGIKVAFESPRILTTVVGGQRLSIPFVRVLSVSIGAAAVEDMDVGVYDVLPALPGVDGLLGSNFLNHFRVTIDRQAVRVSLEPSRADAVVAREWRLPEWRQGDQWRMRWKSPTGGGTYVRRVEGEEVVDDVVHYVLKTGSRSLYIVKANLGWHFEKADGVVALRRTPPVAHDWPLRVGKAWEANYRRETADGDVRQIHRKCSVVGEPTLTIAGGVFATLHVACRDRAGNITEEWWYADEVKNWVRQRTASSEGERVDELMSYSFRQR